MKGISLKTDQEIAVMREGGKKLSVIKKKLKGEVKPGVSSLEIENLATKLIKESGSVPSFKMVPGYKWSTCVNINEGVVHGIPKDTVIFKKGDIVSVDVGLYFKGFHADSAFTSSIDGTLGDDKFLETGKKALNKAISSVKVGKTIGDISKSIEEVIRGEGYSPIESLTGHGVGRELHEAPYVPCFVSGSESEKVQIREGIALAIEVMYCYGSPELEIEEDGWTIRTKNGKMAALFEETVALDSRGRIVLTR